MLTDQEWKELSDYHNGAITGVIKTTAPGSLAATYHVNSATINVKPSLQRNVDNRGRVTWSDNKNKGAALAANISDPDLSKIDAFNPGTQVEFWVGVETGSWQLFNGWVTSPSTQSYAEGGVPILSIVAKDNSDYPGVLFSSSPQNLILVLKSTGSITEVLKYLCKIAGYVLEGSEGLDELEARMEDAGIFESLFDNCNSFNVLLDRILIQNGFAYFISKKGFGRATLTIVGRRDLKGSYRLQYASAVSRSVTSAVSVNTVVGPFDHLMSPLSDLFKTRYLSSLPSLFVEPTVRVLSIDRIKPTKNQFGAMGGIVNIAKAIAVIDQDGKVTWNNTMYVKDILQPQVIWVDTKEEFPWVAAGRALDMTADDFRRLGWVVRRVDLGKEQSFSPQDLLQVSKDWALGYESTAKMVGFPYISSHDIVHLDGVHPRYEERQWRIMQWAHSYYAGRGWFTTLNMGT